MRVLPEQGLLRNQRSEVAHDRAHIAMGQLEPGAGKRVCELLWMLVEAARNFFVRGIEAQGEVRGQHGWRVALCGIVGIRHRAVARAIFWRPLLRAGRALGELPFVAEQVVEEVVAPLGRCLRPNSLPEARFPSGRRLCPCQTYSSSQGPALRGWRPSGFRAHQFRVASAVSLTEGVTAGNQRHGFFVVHGHAAEGFANICLAAASGLGLPLGPSGIHCGRSGPHLHGGQRISPDRGLRCSARPPATCLQGPR